MAKFWLLWVESSAAVRKQDLELWDLDATDDKQKTEVVMFESRVNMINQLIVTYKIYEATKKRDQRSN